MDKLIIFSNCQTWFY